MDNLVIATPRLSDAGTISSGGTLAPAMLVGNLQTQQPSERARWTALSGIEVTIDLLGERPIDFLYLGSHNGSDSFTWRWRAAAMQADLTSAPAFDSGVLPGFAAPAPAAPSFPGSYRSSLLWLRHAAGPGAQSYRHWRLDITDGGNPAGYFEAGRLVLASAWQPTRNLQFGWSLGFDDGSPVERTAGGQSWPLEQGRPRQLDFSLSFLNKAEMYANGYELDRLRGRARDLVVVVNPDVEDQDSAAQLQRLTVHGLMSELTPIVHRRLHVFEKRFRVVELL